MKTPVFGSNRLQSFIDFVTTFGQMRIGLEGLRIFAEVNDKKLQIDGKLLNQTFEGSISLSQGLTHYNDFTVDAALDITLEPDPIIGGSAEIRFIGDGATTPTFNVAFTVGPASAAYDSTLAAINKVIFYYDGAEALYSISAGGSIFGSNPTPVVRTNNPIVATASVNTNIDALDAAIGANLSPAGTRTAGTVAIANTVNQNIDALDSAIGFEAQMSGTPNLVTKTGTVFQMIDTLDARKTSQTVKKTIGWDGAAGTDFVFAGDADHTAQNIDLGAIVPAKARVTGIEIVCTEAAVGVTDITFRAGNASAGEQFIASASCDDLNEVVGITNPALPAAVVMNWAAATKIWIGADPSDNTWGDMTAGKWAIYVTYTYLNNI